MNIRSWTATITASLCTLTATMSLGAGTAAAEGCPNEALRIGFSAYLPDCRAYELVSPPGIEFYTKTGYIGWGENTYKGFLPPDTTFGIQAAVDGEKLAFFSPYAPDGASKEGPNYLMARGVGGWSTESIVPPQSTTNSGVICYNAYAPAFTPDLSAWVLADGWPGEDLCGHDEPSLASGESGGFQNLFLRSREGGYQLIDPPPFGAPNNAWYQAGSEDLSKLVFTDSASLTPEAPQPPIVDGNQLENLYDWAGDTTRLVTVLPNGSATWGSLVYASDPLGQFLGRVVYASGVQTFTHAVSSDGSRVFFNAGVDLYVREHPDQPQSALGGKGECVEAAKACTVQIDASKVGGSGGGGKFMWASTDGSRVFFIDEPSADLTEDTVPDSGPNLYEYDVESGALTDLTPVADARVEGLSGVSADGSYVYFVALGAIPGSGQNDHGVGATAGKPNLYVAHGGATTFIATLEPSAKVGDGCDWEVYCQQTRVSGNGRYLAFNSIGRPTGYDNTDVGSGQADQEIYLYDAVENTLSCASCDPTGAPPTAPAHITQPSTGFIAANGAWATPTYMQRNLTDQGRVYFDTAASLVPQDSNGQADVYEYQEGRLSLISSGTSGTPSIFLDASVSGNDVFFVSGQVLLPYSTSAVRVYDARVDGGFPEPGSVTTCSEEDCRGPVTATPLLAAPSSQTFVGSGNPVSPVTVHNPVKPSKPKLKKKKRRRKKGRKSARRTRSDSRTKRSVRDGHGGLK